MKDCIFADAEEKFVKSTLVYASADDGNLFYDSKKTLGITKDELFDLYTKGMIVVLSGEYLIPVAYKVSDTAGMVTVVHEDTTVVALNFYSSEHTAV